MSIVDKALWVIERNSGGDLSLPAVADACGVSRSHLANAFASTTGWPVVKYLRARRLSKAAAALAKGAPEILAVALDAGYRSHEAFTRAFRDQFDATPEQVRERGCTDGLSLVQPLALRARAPSAAGPPRLSDADAIRALGLPRVHTFDTVIGIPIQWQAFMSRYCEIPHRCEGMPIGVVQPADEEGRFEYVCAAEVTRFARLPEDLVRIELPPRRYAVFEHLAHVSTIFETYAAIWNEALPERGLQPADAPVVERHHPEFDPGTGEGGLSIWIPLAP